MGRVRADLGCKRRADMAEFEFFAGCSAATFEKERARGLGGGLLSRSAGAIRARIRSCFTLAIVFDATVGH